MITTLLTKKKRPYSCVQVWEDTRKKLSKAAVKAELESLVARNLIKSKQISKNTVAYYALPEEESEDDLFALVERVPAIEQELRKVERDLAQSLKRQRDPPEPTNEELSRLKRDYEVEARVNVLRRRVFVAPERLRAAQYKREMQREKSKHLKNAVVAVVSKLCESSRLDVAHLSSVFLDGETTGAYFGSE